MFCFQPKVNLYFFWTTKGGIMDEAKEKLIQIGQKLYQKGFIVASEGNISIRLNDEKILATVKGVEKGNLTEKDLVTIDPSGKPLELNKKPSSEIKMHLKAYQQRPDVKAIVHAHPPYAISLTLAGIKLDKPYLPESVILLGSVPTIPYARPSTNQVAESIQPFVEKTDVMILERHGSLTLGKSLDEAYHKLDILEHTAKIVWLAKQLNSIQPIDNEEVQKILNLRNDVYELTFPILPFD